MAKPKKRAQELATLISRRLPTGSLIEIQRDPTHGWSVNILGDRRRVSLLKMEAGEIAMELHALYDLDEG